MDYIENLEDQVFIKFTAENLPKLFGLTKEGYTYEYNVKTLKDYKKCTMRVYMDGKFMLSGWMIFRDYTATIFGRSRIISNHNNKNCSALWRERVLSLVGDKERYAKEFNKQIDKELMELKEEYKCKQLLLESLRIGNTIEME